MEWVEPFRLTDGIDDDPFVAFAWPRPDFNGAAHEFLIGLLATTAAPEDEEAWEDWWFAPPAPGVLEARFESAVDSLDLDGPGPRFLQDRDPLDGAEEKAVAALLIDAPGAQTLRNNADLFVKRGGAQVLGAGDSGDSVVHAQCLCAVRRRWASYISTRRWPADDACNRGRSPVGTDMAQRRDRRSDREPLAGIFVAGRARSNLSLARPYPNVEPQSGRASDHPR